jgi:hypothetical protein
MFLGSFIQVAKAWRPPWAGHSIGPHTRLVLLPCMIRLASHPRRARQSNPYPCHRLGMQTLRERLPRADSATLHVVTVGFANEVVGPEIRSCGRIASEFLARPIPVWDWDCMGPGRRNTLQLCTEAR